MKVLTRAVTILATVLAGASLNAASMLPVTLRGAQETRHNLTPPARSKPWAEKATPSSKGSGQGFCPDGKTIREIKHPNHDRPARISKGDSAHVVPTLLL
jgi:hypothetical protein